MAFRKVRTLARVATKTLLMTSQIRPLEGMPSAVIPAAERAQPPLVTKAIRLEQKACRKLL